jgi:ribosomal protein uS17
MAKENDEVTNGQADEPETTDVVEPEADATADEPVGEESDVEETVVTEPAAEAAPEAEQAPAEEPAAEEPVADEAPAEEAPAEEPVPEELAAEAAPEAEEAPAEEQPAAEAPAAEPAAEAPAATPQAPAREKRRSSKTKAEKRAAREAAKERRKAAPRPARERKPLVRLPKPEKPRADRKERRGFVVSAAMDKTIVVRVDSAKPDRRYKKVVRRSTKFHAHDERNEANVGDLVRIVETRPLSRTKNWRLAEIVEAAK